MGGWVGGTYQWRKAFRLNMRSNWAPMRFHVSWMAVLLPMKVKDICKGWVGGWVVEFWGWCCRVEEGKGVGMRCCGFGEGGWVER